MIDRSCRHTVRLGLLANGGGDQGNSPTVERRSDMCVGEGAISRTDYQGRQTSEGLAGGQSTALMAPTFPLFDIIFFPLPVSERAVAPWNSTTPS